jgi:hypothetical protein
MNLLCKVGIHSWQTIGFTNLLLSDHLRYCRRCLCGRMTVCYGSATVRYTPEQMCDLMRKYAAQV